MSRLETRFRLSRIACLVASAFVGAGTAHAGFTTKVDLTDKRELRDGCVYCVPSGKNTTLRSSSGASPLWVSPGSTAVIYIPEYAALELQGGSGSYTYGAGAGVRVPSGATLVVTGKGSLVAKGGKAANGGNGSSGGSAKVVKNKKDSNNEYGYSGPGGNGGCGGGGAGAGIGGMGGEGYTTMPEPSPGWHFTDGDWKWPGWDGYSGKNGSKGEDCGTVYILGGVTVTGTAGGAGKGGSAGSQGAYDSADWTLSYRGGGGGYGAGGGGGGAALYGIGGGGGAGGSGGNGGWGGRYRTSRGMIKYKATGGNGGGGSGGSKDGQSGSGSRSNGVSGMHGGNGGDGASGGSGGGTGANGTIYVDTAGVTLEGAPSFTTATSHPAIEYKMVFDDDWRLNESKDVKLGYLVPDGPVAKRWGYKFEGWYTGRNGTGEWYHFDTGRHRVLTWTHVGDLPLYPKWSDPIPTEPLSEVTLWINGTEVLEGNGVEGDGWK